MLAVISYPPIPIFEVGPLRLSLHGVFAALGFLAGAWLATRYVRERGYDVEKFASVLTWALVGSILGARFFTIPAHLGDPGFGIADALSPAGSYSILGGFAGGVLGGWLRMRRLGLPFLPYADMASFGMALGTIVGRIGDLAIVEHLGGPTNFFLGYGIKPGYDVAPQHNALECVAANADGLCGVYHPSALYDLAGATLLLLFLMWLYRSRRLHYGQLFFTWVTWYGFQRFLLDFSRLSLDVNGDATLGPFTWSQWSGLAAGIGGLVALGVLNRRTPVISDEGDRAMGALATAPSGEPPTG